eukprot:g44532.t1
MFLARGRCAPGPAAARLTSQRTLGRLLSASPAGASSFRRSWDGLSVISRPRADRFRLAVSPACSEGVGGVGFVDLVPEGTCLSGGEVGASVFAFLEGKKGQRQLAAAVSGEVVAVNEQLVSSPGQAVFAGDAAAWLLEVEPLDQDAADAEWAALSPVA